MVKGRSRAKTIVGCKTLDDCCSPNPKRRGRRVDDKLDDFLHVNGCSEIITEPVENNNEITNGVASDSLLSPVRDQTRTLFSPPTPHRIELCDDSPEPKPQLTKTAPAARTNGPTQNHKLTDYFPVRRSVRKTKKIVLEEKQLSLERALRDGTEDGLIVETFEGKGRGVVAARAFEKGDFVVEYRGDLVDIVEAKRREQKYAQDQSAGCYMYYFKHNGQQFCIDATAESGRLGRLVNHSRNGNLVTRTVCVDGRPRLVLIAKTFIKSGEEVTYDYGDRSKESLQYHPWLAY